jgi:carbon monoxide dehydrogenase subunit G
LRRSPALDTIAPPAETEAGGRALEIKGEQRFESPRELVWDLLLDPRALQAAIPGCERLECVGPNSYDLTVRVGISAIKGTYTGNVTVADQQPHDSYRLLVKGSGKPGSVTGEALMSLSDTPEGTLVRYTGEVKAQGGIARLGSRLLGGAAKLMIGQFFKGMEKQARQRAA